MGIVGTGLKQHGSSSSRQTAAVAAAAESLWRATVCLCHLCHLLLPTSISSLPTSTLLSQCFSLLLSLLPLLSILVVALYQHVVTSLPLSGIWPCKHNLIYTNFNHNISFPRPSMRRQAVGQGDRTAVEEECIATFNRNSGGRQGQGQELEGRWAGRQGQWNRPKENRGKACVFPACLPAFPAMPASPG